LAFPTGDPSVVFIEIDPSAQVEAPTQAQAQIQSETETETETETKTHGMAIKSNKSTATTMRAIFVLIKRN